MTNDEIYPKHATYNKLARRLNIVMAARQMFTNLPEGTNFAIAIGGASGAISQKAVYANSIEEAQKAIFRPLSSHWAVYGPRAFPELITSWGDDVTTDGRTTPIDPRDVTIEAQAAQIAALRAKIDRVIEATSNMQPMLKAMDATTMVQAYDTGFSAGHNQAMRYVLRALDDAANA